MLLAVLSIVALLASGCYTQVGVTREGERGYEAADKPADQQVATEDDANRDVQQDDSDAYDNSTYDNGSYDNSDWGYHPRVGYTYYYPSYAPSTFWPSYSFSAAYANPWAYSYYNCYDPWWCGSPYISYSPYWDGYNPYGYYSPYYSYYPYYNGYGYSVRNVSHGTRDIGTTRGTTDRRDINRGSRMPSDPSVNLPAGGALPTGSRNGSATGVSRGSVGSPTVDGASRNDGSTRGSRGTTVAPRSNPNTPRASSSRTRSSRVYRQRGSAT